MIREIKYLSLLSIVYLATAQEGLTVANPTEAQATADAYLDEKIQNACFSSKGKIEHSMRHYYFLDQTDMTEEDKELAKSYEGANTDYTNADEASCLEATTKIFQEICSINPDNNKTQLKTISQLQSQTQRYQNVTSPEMRHYAIRAYSAFMQCAQNNYEVEHKAEVEKTKWEEEKKRWGDPSFLETKSSEEKIKIINEELPKLSDKELTEIILKMQKFRKQKLFD